MNIEIDDLLKSELEEKIAFNEINNNLGFLCNSTKTNSVELTNCC